jgi:Flp pilus assembly protein TadD
MQVRESRLRPAVVSGLAAAVSAGLLAGACSGLGEIGGLAKSAQLAPAAAAEQPANPGSELDRAIQYWGKQYAKNPRDLKAALSYAKNLKANGQKAEALSVVQAASIFHGNHRELASEYGRLALEAGQVQLAQKLLAVADDPANPDWRIISARGTALAKDGHYAEAVPFYERALKLAPERSSLLNNLALAYAAQGEAAKAEPYLRRASAQEGGEAKVHHNLALVLGLQGKYEEARQAAAFDLAPDAAASDVAYMQKIARLEPKSSPSTARAEANIAASDKQSPPALRNAIADAATSTPDPWAPKVAQSP